MKLILLGGDQLCMWQHCHVIKSQASVVTSSDNEARFKDCQQLVQRLFQIGWAK